MPRSSRDIELGYFSVIRPNPFRDLAEVSQSASKLQFSENLL